MQFIGAGAIQRQRLGTRIVIERQVVGRTANRLTVVEAGQHGIDAIEAGAGHQADVVLRSH